MTMKIYKLKKWILLGFALCILMILSACSSEKIINLLSADRNVKDTSDGGDGLKMIYTQDETNYHNLGDIFKVGYPTQENPDNIGFECTVVSADYLYSALDEKVDQTKMTDSTEYYSYEEPKMVEKNDYSQYGMVMCKIKIKNINMPEDYNITGFACVSVDEDENVHEISLPVYFDALDRSKKNGEFYHCKIPVGEEREMVVGWLVETNQYRLDTLKIQVPYAAQ